MTFSITGCTELVTVSFVLYTSLIKIYRHYKSIEKQPFSQLCIGNNAEIHILWAQHQVHHSSEDYNLTAGLRHPFLHNWCGLVSSPKTSKVECIQLFENVFLPYLIIFSAYIFTNGIFHTTSSISYASTS